MRFASPALLFFELLKGTPHANDKRNKPRTDESGHAKW